MVIDLSKNNSLLNHWVAELRDVDVQNDRMRFRRNLERIGEVAAYELSKSLVYKTVDVTTPLGTASTPLLEKQPVLANCPALRSTRGAFPLPFKFNIGRATAI